MALQLWEALKEAIVAYTGISPITFFTFLALLFTAYYAISDFFVPSEPPPRPRNLEEMVQPTPPPVQVGEISEEELKAYDGSDPKKPLLMAIKGQIYDVSRSRMFYGPGGPYALFAGKDASRALAKMSFEEKDLNGDLSGLSSYEMGTLQDWEHQFMSKYDKAGTVKTSVPLTEAATDGEPSESVPGGAGDGAEAAARPTRDGPSEASAVRSDEAPSRVDADKE